MDKVKKAPSTRVTFLLPMSGATPCGGFKVVYEYANYLEAKGYEVSVVHPNVLRIDAPFASLGLTKQIKAVWRFVRVGCAGDYRPDRWFRVNAAVRLMWVTSLAAHNIPDADVVIATAWETAEWVLSYPGNKGKQLYLIQHLETWAGPRERVLETWKAPITKIVIAGWLQRLACTMGERTHLISNGLDFSRFQLKVSPETRDPRSILMLYHSIEWKGSADGLVAFALAQRMIPELKLTLFGIGPPPVNLPAGVQYYRNPDQDALVDLYNEAAIFVGPSWSEGWGLPPAEALMCGAALAVTDEGADEVYAIHERTALRSPAKDPEALGANIVRLVQDGALRVRIAYEGHEAVQGFTWERAGKELEELLTC